MILARLQGSKRADEAVLPFFVSVLIFAVVAMVCYIVVITYSGSNAQVEFAVYEEFEKELALNGILAHPILLEWDEGDASDDEIYTLGELAVVAVTDQNIRDIVDSEIKRIMKQIPYEKWSLEFWRYQPNPNGQIVGDRLYFVRNHEFSSVKNSAKMLLPSNSVFTNEVVAVLHIDGKKSLKMRFS